MLKASTDIERLVRWPDFTDPRWTAGLGERARSLREDTDYFVVMRMVASHGPFQTACDLRGTENFLIDMALNPEFAHALLDKITTAIDGLLRLAMQAGGKWFDMVELPGDDYAGNTQPDDLARHVPQIYQALHRPAGQNHPGTQSQSRIMLHSDGAITKLLPDMITLGVDVLHPLEPLPATDIPAIKASFGKKSTFLGGIDISHAMPRQSCELSLLKSSAALHNSLLAAATSSHLPITSRPMSRPKMSSPSTRLPKNLVNTPFSTLSQPASDGLTFSLSQDASNKL